MKLLMVATSHAGLCALGHPTGMWLEELAVPYYALAAVGHQIAIASVTGGRVPLDPLGLELTRDTAPEVERFIIDPEAHDLIGSTLKISDLDAADYHAVFLPGGYGAMFDLPDCLQLGRILAQFMALGCPVAAVGHGVAGLISTRNAADKPALEGRHLTCFSNAEEASLGLCEYVPFMLETRLRKLGAIVETGSEFKAFAKRDGNLITGQNPASTQLVTESLLSALA